MPEKVKIYKSQMPEGFEQLVEEFRQAKAQHTLTVDVPAPTAAHPLIEQCVKRTFGGMGKPDAFVPNYEIIDDTILSLEAKKEKLTQQVLASEKKQKEQVLPSGKARLLKLKYNESLNKGKLMAPDDISYIVNYETNLAKLDKLDRDVAHILAEIDDLTEDTIKSFVVPEPYGD